MEYGNNEAISDDSSNTSIKSASFYIQPDILADLKNNTKIQYADNEKNTLIPYIKSMPKSYFFLKRIFDIVSSACAIILLFPLLVITSIIVMCTSRGPIFYISTRVGKNGIDFKMLKFRSMYKDAELKLKNYLDNEQYKQWLTERKIDRDPRITKVGKFLRKTSIDELPQLFNILIGSMSVVGPRPITREELDDHFKDYERSILLSMRPGLLGFWAVHGRSSVTFESGERQTLELEYYSHRGLLFDLGLIFKTIPLLLNQKGAK